MTFYQELQLDQAGSKEYIRQFKKPREKLKHILIYLLKIALTISFSMLFITAFTLLLGSENSIVGLVLLLSVLVFRKSDLGIHASHSVLGIFIIFAIFAAGPKLSNMLPAGPAFLVNVVCIMLILLIGCRNVKMFNHSTLVLSYLFLQAYDVSGDAYAMRLVGLLIGAVMVSAVLYRNHRKINYEYGFKDLFKDFSLSSERSRWQIRFTLGISSVMLIASLIGIPKSVWIGIAAMSVFTPIRQSLLERVKFRAPGNILGSIFFLVLYLLMPEFMRGYMGILGGIGTGLSASYGWQTVCNSFSSLGSAVPVLGLTDALIFRVLNNIIGSVYAFAFDLTFERILVSLNNMRQNRRKEA